MTIERSEEASAEIPGTGRPGMSWTGDGALTPALDPPYGGEGAAATPVEDLRLASFGRRAFGYAIDLGIITLIAVVASALLFPDEFAASANSEETSRQLLWLVGGIPIPYNWFFNTIGWSPGKRAVRLRLVDADGRVPGRARGLKRTIMALLSAVLHLGYIWAAFDRQTRTWHDRAAGTYVVEIGDDDELVRGRE